MTVVQKYLQAYSDLVDTHIELRKEAIRAHKAEYPESEVSHDDVRRNVCDLVEPYLASLVRGRDPQDIIAAAESLTDVNLRMGKELPNILDQIADQADDEPEGPVQ